MCKKSFLLVLHVSRTVAQMVGEGSTAYVSQKPLALSRYPQDALQCFATATEPSHKVICPEDRSSYCVKEVANASRRDCGSALDFSMDQWDVKLGQCVYRKCADRCDGETNITFFGSRGAYERSSYCCKMELCNGGERLAGSVGLIAATALAFLML